MVERERFTVFQRQGFRWAVNVGRWTPQGGSEGEEFKMLWGTEGGSVRTLCNCKPDFKFLYVLMSEIQVVPSSCRRAGGCDAVSCFAEA